MQQAQAMPAADPVVAMAPVLSFDPPALAGAALLETWQANVAGVFEVSLPERDAVPGFRARATTYHMGGLVLDRAQSVRQRFLRTPATVARSGIDHLLVQVYLRGRHAGEADGRPYDCAPGTVSVLDLSRPMQAEASDFDAYSMAVPSAALAPLVKDPGALHGLTLPPDSPMGALLGDHMKNLHRQAAQLNAAEAAAAAAGTLAMACHCLGASAAGQAFGAGMRAGTLAAQARHLIDTLLDLPELGPELLARRLGVSRAALYRAFEPYGGVAHVIRHRRLTRCLRELVSPAGQERRIADIAHAWCFENEAAFSRAFRRAFGLSPRDARARPLPGSGGLTDWLRRL